MLLSQRPLLSSDADASLFVGRAQGLAEVDRAIMLGFNTVVFGAPGSGRTSFLRQVQRRLPHDGRWAIFVSAQGWKAARDITLAIRAGFGDDVRGPRYRVEPRTFGFMERVVEDRGPALTEADIQYLGMSIAEAAGALEIPPPPDGRWTVLLDDVAGTPGHQLFGRFRDEMWQLPVQWIVSTTTEDRQQMLRPPADAFFDTAVLLPDLTEDEANQLLAARITDDDPVARRLQKLVPEIAGGVRHRTPRALITALRGAAAATSPGQLVRGRALQETRASALGRGEAMLFSELESLGPTHAGDEELLGRLGVTRSRVVQLLSRLEAEGLVTWRTEGRRKVFEVVAPSLDAS